METIRIPRIIQDTIRGAVLRGRTVGLVPTMGALHDGHMSLIRTSMRENNITVASIFVNPTQFAAGEDYEAYPRESDDDAKKLRDIGVDVLFMPELKAMYPEGFATSVSVKGGLTDRLCGAFRPGHFDGVATVVAKLLNIIGPHRAYFGLKDYQQYLVIKRMAEDLNMPVEIVGCPTFRESDGLAMSSRNAYLNEQERHSAPVIYKALAEASGALSMSLKIEDISAMIERAIKAEPGVTEVQYAGVYDHLTLEPLAEFKGRALIAAAVKMGSTRLIDNIIVG